MANNAQARPLGSLIVSFDRLREPVKESNRRPGPFPYYGASGIVDRVDAYIFEGAYLLVAEDGENLRTRQTPIAFMAIGKFWVNNHAHVLQANAEADTRYLMYALSVADVAAYLTGSTMPKLTSGNLARIPIPFRPLHEQRAIASILGTLDDKIELNRKMSATLEAMARGLFKAWFVDFDPIGAKAKSIETLMTPEIAALFPNSLVKSPVGTVPSGWEVTLLRNLLAFNYGKPLKAEDRNPGQISVWGSNGKVGVHNKAFVQGPGIIIGRKGNPGTVTWSQDSFWPIDTTFYVTTPLESAYLYYFYFALRELDLPHLSADSAVPGLNRVHASLSKMLYPPEPIVRTFADIIAPIFSRAHLAAQQSRTLAIIRDTLLPKLVSGKICVTEAERTVEKIA